MNKQWLIMCILRNEYDKALHQYRSSSADRAAIVAGSAAWESMNKDDGIGRNPYDIKRAIEKERKHEEHYLRVREAYDYAVSVFLGEKE